MLGVGQLGLRFVEEHVFFWRRSRVLGGLVGVSLLSSH